MRSIKKPVPLWTLIVVSVIAVFGLLTAAYQTNELGALRDAIRVSEKGEIVSPVQSALNATSLCRRNWFMRFESWYRASDVCQP